MSYIGQIFLNAMRHNPNFEITEVGYVGIHNLPLDFDSAVFNGELQERLNSTGTIVTVDDHAMYADRGFKDVEVMLSDPVDLLLFQTRVHESIIMSAKKSRVWLPDTIELTF